MGIRGELPTPRPDAIESPIPNAGLEQEELQQLVALDQPISQTSQTSQVAEAEEEFDPELENPPMEQEAFDDIQRAPAGEPTFEELQEELGLSDASPASKAIDSHLQQIGFWEELGARVQTSVGRNAKERMSLLKAKFPKKRISKNKDGDLFIDGIPADPEIGEGGAREFVMDIADWTGDITEAVLSSAVELGVVAAGTASSFGLGVAPAYIAGAAAGSGIGVKGRGDMVEALGGERMEADKELEMIAGTTALNLAFLGAGALVRKTGGAVINAVKAAKNNLPTRRIERLAVITKNIKDVAEEIGLKTDATSIKQNIHGGIETAYTKLQNSIGVLDDEAVKYAGGKAFVPKNYLEESLKMMDDYGAVIDPKTFRVSIPDREVYAFGAEGGEKVLKQLAEEHNAILDNFVIRDGQVLSGGMSARKMIDKAKKLGDIANTRFMENKGKIGRVYKKLANASSSDRMEMMTDVLKNTEYGGHIEDTYKEFADNIGIVREFKNLFKSAKDSEKLIDVLITPKNSENLEKLKGILGKDSAEWGQLVSTWMNDAMENKFSSTSGIFDAKGFLDKVKSLGPATREVLMTTPQFNRLQREAVKYGKIATKDLIHDTGNQAILESIVKVWAAPFLGIQQLPGTRARAVWQLTKSNATAADYLLDDGFINLAKKAETLAEKKSWLKTKKAFSILINNSQKATLSNGRKVYVSTPALRNTLMMMTTPEGVPEAIGKQVEGIYEGSKQAAKQSWDSMTSSNLAPEEFVEPTEEELIKELGL